MNAMQTATAHPAGFVAGTLVHTDKGLVPIQDLKVGDKALSKPEDGNGAMAYFVGHDGIWVWNGGGEPQARAV